MPSFVCRFLYDTDTLFVDVYLKNQLMLYKL